MGKIIFFSTFALLRIRLVVMRPLLLLSNDDGVEAKGLQKLIEMLSPMADLFVVAPDCPRSGASCSLTSVLPIKQTLMEAESGLTIYSCSGTPADCVKLALDQLLQRQPDMVIGGINHGGNASINVHYSGTLGAVKEGVLQGIPSVAFSLLDHDLNADFSPLQPYVERITQTVLDKSLPYGSCLNVNFPAVKEFAGVKICRMAYSRWQEEYVPCESPHGGHYYWLGGECVNDEPDEEDTDSWALERDYVAITPIRVDETDYDLKDMLNDWEL
jgi:5'-nucleotidase